MGEGGGGTSSKCTMLLPFLSLKSIDVDDQLYVGLGGVLGNK